MTKRARLAFSHPYHHLRNLFRPRVCLLLAGLILVACPCVPVRADSADWQRLKSSGEASLSVNNYGAAEHDLTAALVEAEKFGPNDIRVADTLRALGGLYCTRGQFNRAEPLFERELRVREKALGGESPQVVACVGKLAQFYLNHGAAAKGERLANLLVSFADRKVKEQQSIKVNFTNLDKFYGCNKDYSECRSLLQRLQENSDRTTANEDLELATTLDSLGHLYQDKRRFDLAEKMYRNALAFRERTLPPGHLALALSYENLAGLCAEQGKNGQAEPLYKRALEVTEKTLQPERPEVFARLDELARTYINTGQTSSAESLYKRALVILSKDHANSPDSGKASYALAQLYFRQGRYSAAEPLIKHALAISEGLNGPEHASVAPILDMYADVLEKVNKGSEAAKMRTRARSIRGVSVSQKPESGSF